MIKLGVNIDHIATIRQSRGTTYPDILEAAKLACQGGADQITVHLREDRRHIQDEDVYDLRRALQLPLNLEMAAVDEITEIAVQVRPDQATLVPERREEQTTESGLKVSRDYSLLEGHIQRLRAKNIEVSLFVDPVLEDVKAAAELKVQAVEFHTGPYALAGTDEQRAGEIERLGKAANEARKFGLRVASGHGLHYQNLSLLIRQVPQIEEVNIGHSIVARAVFVGLEQAVAEIKRELK